MLSMDNLPLLAKCLYELYVYDNSGSHAVLGLSLVDYEVFITAEDADWIKKLLKFKVFWVFGVK